MKILYSSPLPFFDYNLGRDHEGAGTDSGVWVDSVSGVAIRGGSGDGDTGNWNDRSIQPDLVGLGFVSSDRSGLYRIFLVGDSS